MGASFVAASSRYLYADNSSLVTPFTLAAWVYPTSIAAGSAHVVSVADTATTTNFWGMRRTAAQWAVTTAGTTGRADVGGTVTANAWHFILARFITSTNRRMAIIEPTGLISHIAGTGASSPASIDRIGIGARIGSTVAEYWDGSIGEVVIISSDIQDAATATGEGLLRQIAYGGPYSVPHIAANLVVYRSLFQSLSSDQDIAGDAQDGGPYGRLNWVNSGGATLGPHPPLPGWYQDRELIRPIGMI